MVFDAERFPPYLPERKGYLKMTYINKENNVAIPLLQTTVYFEIKNSALNRFKGGSSRRL